MTPFSADSRDQLLQSYDADALFASAYALARWTPSERVTLAPGMRIDHWSLADGTSASPWVQGELRLSSSLKLRGGAGVHRQFPGFEQVAGLRHGTDLRAERAIHADVGLERALGREARVQVTFYHRREQGLVRLPDSEVRVVGNQLMLPSQTSRWVNALDGYARGVELLVQRRSNNGLSGWLSYSFGVNRYDDSTSGERFDGDVEQRHTFNAYGMYRVTDWFSLAAKLRLGSNVPAVGYWEQRGSEVLRRHDAQHPPRTGLRAARRARQSHVQLAVQVGSRCSWKS